MSFRLEPWCANIVCGVFSRSNTTLSGGYWQVFSRKWPRVCNCTSIVTESPVGVVYESTAGWSGLSLPRFFPSAPKSAVRVNASGSTASNSPARAADGVLASPGDCGSAPADDAMPTTASAVSAAHRTRSTGSRLPSQVYGPLGSLASRHGRTHFTGVRWVAGVAGTVLLAVVLWDAFETIILPRRGSGRIRLTSLFYRATWKPWRGTARLLSGRRREAFLSFYGPLSLIVLLALWAAGIVFAFGLLQWAAGSALTMAGGAPSFGADVYMSGTTFFTLGLGDVVPRTPAAKVLTTVEAGMGFAF